MKKLLLKNIISPIKGIFYGDKNILNKFIYNISTDSRSIKKDSLFIALKGEKFDGHDFINKVLENNYATCVVSEKMLDLNKNFIKVESTYQALLDLAEYYLSLFNNLKIIAVTGSCGKTTTKDMIAAVLSQEFNIIKSKGNFNNQIGVPLTIFNIRENTQIAIFEMGTSNFGEIDILSKVSKPDICVITNIGHAHIKNFLTQDGVLKAKSEIFNHAKKNFLAVLNSDDEFLKKLNKNPVIKNKIYCGLDKNNNLNNIFAYDIDSQKKSFKVNVMNSKIKINLKQPGDFLIKNALIAIAIAKYFNIKDNQIKFALENIILPNMRMHFIKASNNNLIIDDSYNASPDSMQAAIDTLSLLDLESKKNKICILGDMLELGEKSNKFHNDIGIYLSNKKNIDLVICIGSIAKSIFDGISNIHKKYYKTKIDFFYDLDNHDINKKDFMSDSIILVKASRDMHFEDIINKLLAYNNHASVLY